MIYVVKPGDTLTYISETTGVPAWKIIYDNQISNPDQLVLGQALLLLQPEEAGGMGEDMYVSGYAYPFIEPYILEQAFPALNELLVFSYGFTFEGELVPPPQSDTWMIEAAWENGIEPLLVLTPFSNGAFNNQLVKVLVEEPEVQQRVIANLLETVEQKGFSGVDIDFEYVLPENRIGYAEFVGSVRKVMNENGYKVSVALAPKTSADQKGLLYEGIDYKLLGENADNVFLMTYEWGYSYSEPMAVAPINKVRQVVEYALTEIPREKILMGIPNYAYDWPLPYEKGITKAKVIGNVEAVQIAWENGAFIQYEEVAQTPHFEYTKNGVAHEVWFEDVRSIEAKLLLAREFNLLGVGYWNLMRPFRANWLLVENPQMENNIT